LLKTGFFRQVRELKIQTKNPGGALYGKFHVQPNVPGEVVEDTLLHALNMT